jgi:hypothetical protein
MRKIINNLLYDTETASKICSIKVDELNPNAEDTTLYRSKNGRFFIAGKGGVRWRAGVRTELDGITGEGLATVTDEEAKAIVVHSGTIDMYESLFGPVEEA